MERAGFWHRGLAAAIDLLVGGAVVVGGGAALFVAAHTLDLPAASGDYVLGVVSALLVLAYTSCDVWFGGTPGKLVVGLTIAGADGARATKWTLALRWSSKYFGYLFGLAHAITLDPLSYYLSGFMNLVVVVGCLQALDEHRRAWHDEWAGTAVWRRRTFAAPGPATPPPLPFAPA